MTTVIKWKTRAVKDLRALPSQDQKPVREKVNALQAYPDIQGLDIKKLTDKNGQYRLRVKNYRVLFEMEGGEIVVIDILRILRRTSTTY
ncbi:hypothetical protein NUKP32_31990 [Klebsiella variicola]|uniref:type II toxin-antitoxin system RelE family toxin n=1 Tax=Klebsiella variicola TaxID=244366 RepID=UPI0021813E6B|nr:type II toxin-antitoxin system RelE/ParE family toxin [Klebsiella variicola]GKJ53301.1 hypothetical protein NUKP32_31990 [Klebsiella variicola]HDU5937083.1 type II toxin-antitoxin system RelE/ParE family toxin [Klebsiella variicola]HEJ0334521.1 type II toxin-antitoxin system RelE/ParE family toxin [Klebsiella aerogenes]